MDNSSRQLKIGQFVKSKAGRDKDKIFVVIEIVDELYVHIADGDLRKLEKPKMKKVKHLKILDLCSPDIQQKILQKEYLNNAMLKKEVDKAYLIKS